MVRAPRGTRHLFVGSETVFVAGGLPRLQG
jgi:hypothetical protein